jgi:hypothetical protein
MPFDVGFVVGVAILHLAEGVAAQGDFDAGAGATPSSSTSVSSMPRLV